MKRIVAGVLVAMMLALGSSLAWAEEEHHGEQGTEVEVGLKVWWNKWKRTAVDSFNSDNTILAGPVAEIKFHNNIFIEAAYLITYPDYKVNFPEESVKFDRQDIDIAAGYMFNHAFGAFVGYRDSSMKASTKEKETSFGPLVGIRGAMPVNEAFSIYGKLTYLINRLKTETPDQVTNQSNNGWIAEAGVKYELSREFSANLGYQYETTKAQNDGFQDTFRGVTLGAMYAFE